MASHRILLLLALSCFSLLSFFPNALAWSPASPAFASVPKHTLSKHAQTCRGSLAISLSASATNKQDAVSSERVYGLTRRGALLVAAGAVIGSVSSLPKPVGAASPAASAKEGGKLKGISDEQLAKMVEKDVVEKQFMVTGDLTRELYSEECTFKDEIDTYALDKWIDGTQKLFKNSYSHMELDGPVSVTAEKVQFRFKERLMFNIPLIYPKVPLTGKLELTRGKDGLFTKYAES